jgi:hypothetical protein
MKAVKLQRVVRCRNYISSEKHLPKANRSKERDAKLRTFKAALLVRAL